MVYRQMANVYDHLMKHAPYEEWVQFTEALFKRHHQRVDTIADLGCGTGEITTKLALSGYQVTGVDYSEDMLTHAAYKAEEKGTEITWIYQDIRTLEGIAGLDAAVSFCDVINYITAPDDVLKSFQRISDSLVPGGLFLFDVHHLPFIEAYYLDETFADVTDDVSYIWFCTPGEKPGEMYHDLTFFYQTDGYYERFDEVHHQRTFPIFFYEQMLKQTGFEDIKVYADFSLTQEDIKEDAERIFFSAVKKSG